MWFGVQCWAGRRWRKPARRPLCFPIRALRASAGLEEELAWDTFLLFPPEAGWGNAPPSPAYVMHVGKRLPPDRRLNGEKLAEQVNRLRGSR
jgi:hypothetical protein